MKKVILLALLAYSCSLCAQTDYYWYKGQKVYLEKLNTKKFVVFDTYNDSISLKEALHLNNSSIIKFEKNNNISSNLNEYETDIPRRINWAVIEDDNFAEFNRVNVIYDAPFFMTSNNVEAGLSNLFYVKLNISDDIVILERLAKENNVEILGNNRFMPLWYTLLCTNNSTGNALSMANFFYETQLFSASEPDLMTDDFYFCTNDTYFGNQWGLNNTGQNNGISGIDINFCPANSITSGNQNIIVAVLDQGVELNHPDLTNMCTISYDTETSSSPSQVYGDHGTACAGIIGANSNNNLGVSGIAPDCKIMSISNSMASNPNSRQLRADGINFAVNNGVSVISNSWGSSVQYQIIDDAIDNALTNGRNGKGCIVVFSSGNSNGSVSYPANCNDSILVVGAISPCGQRKSPTSCDGENWGSCFGTQLDIMAPGVLIPTTDRQGANGYNTALGTAGDYVQNFNGTSSACPHVSGIAALMLSVNPNLTGQKVHNIIDSTAQRIRTDLYTYTDNPSIHPNGSWNNQMGYGLIDAHAAVMEAYFYDRQILGSNTISPCSIIYPCNGIITYNLNSSSMPSNTTLQWSVSGNLALVSSNNQSISVLPTGIGTGTITISYTHEGYTVTKQKEITIESLPPSSNYYCNYSTTGNMTFSNELYINGTFTINNGHVVTISCIGHCLPDAKIVVQPGGKLIVNDGKLTSYCPDKMWDGIYVVGNKNQRQLAQYQGTLEVKNSSLIENAKCAIHNWNGSNYNTSGGIITVSGNSILHNNGRAAEFVEYMNTNANGSQVNDASGFQFCTFKNDDNNIFSSNNITFQSFVKMSGVKGIGFTACNFRNDCSTVNGQQYAIESIGSGFAVGPHCSGAYNINTCVCGGNLTKSKFARMGRGIKATNNGSTYSFTVENTLFDTCYWSVAVEAVNNYSVTESDFDESTYPTFHWNTSPAGVNTKNSSGFTIEGNNFYTLYTTHPSVLDNGVYCQGSGSDANIIYRNTFEGFYYALMTGGNDNAGLQFQCNDFKKNFNRDVMLESASSVQGSSSKSAGNKFTTQTPYNITSTPTITYYHSGLLSASNIYYPSVVSSNVSRLPLITANNCNSTLCDFNIVGPVIGKSASDNEDIALYESLQQIYESRLADYDAAGYDFLLENFEDGDADIVATARLMQDTLISLRRAMAEIANRNIDAILQDTVVFDRDALNGWYNRINTTTAKYSLVNSYFEVGEYALARQELATIPQRFALTTDELAEYDNFCQYQSLREAVYTDGRNYAQLTEDEIAELQVMVERNTGVSSAYANSVLCFFYGICRDEEIDIDFDIDAPMNSKSTTEVVEENAEPLAIYVYPNPADEELNILLNSLPEGTTMIEFHDVTGRLVLSEEIKSANTSINISSLKQGVYMYRIVNGDSVIARDRIVKE